MSIPFQTKAKYGGRCASCGRGFKKGTTIIWGQDQLTYHLPDQCPEYRTGSKPSGVSNKPT